MSTFVLVAGAGKKLAHPARADELYRNPLFRLNLGYAESFASDGIFILSARHGLLDRATVIEPYSSTLERMPITHLKLWASMVLRQLGNVADLERDHFVFLAGQHFRKRLEPHLPSHEVPLKGYSLDRQLGMLQAYRR